MFVQDLIKSSIWLDEDSSTPVLRTPPGEGGPTPTLETDPGTLVGPTCQVWEPGSEIAAITGPPDSDTDRWKLISEYLRLRTIPDNKIKTRCLACRVKRYLIHDDELYYRNTSGILQRCIPIEEGEALLLNIHDLIFGHHASSMSMVGKAFQQGFY
jgi:hypothetical protein